MPQPAPKTNGRTSKLTFRCLNGSEITAKEWFAMWGPVVPGRDELVYRDLITKHASFSPKDFEQIGIWKDGAWAKGQWSPNVASVAYEIWMQAASELPACPDDSQVQGLLETWSHKTRIDHYEGGRHRKEQFGLARASTLLHFMSGGRYPIFDRRVKKAVEWLQDSRVKEDVSWYMASFCPLFWQIADACGAKDSRLLDQALFRYGQFRADMDSSTNI